MRLAVFSPLPPQESGIADYVADLTRAMSRLAEIDLYLPTTAPRPEGVDGTVARYDGYGSEIPPLDRYHAVFYHMGNHIGFHGEMLAVSARHPGIVVLHDVVLHNLIHAFYCGKLGRPELYVREAATAHGESGRVLAETALADDRVLIDGVSAHTVPLNLPVVASAVGVVVHSRFAANLVNDASPRVPLRVIPHYAPTPAAPLMGTSVERRRLLRKDPRFTVGAFGHMVPTKRIGSLIAALASLPPNVDLLLVGSELDRWRREARRLGVRSRVRFVDWIGARELDGYIGGVDAVVNLRHPNMGETSGIASRSLSAGRPLIVSTGGWYDEIPDEAVMRVPPNEHEVGTLTDHLRALIDHPRLRASMSRAARAYAATRSLDEVARSYVDFAADPDVRMGSLRATLVARTAASVATATSTDEDAITRVIESVTYVFPDGRYRSSRST